MITIAHCCSCPSLMVYSDCTFGSIWVIWCDGFIQVVSTLFDISYSSLEIAAFSCRSQPLVISISPGDVTLVTIIALLSRSQCHYIKYQKHFFKLSLPPVLNNFLSNFCIISSIAAMIWRTSCWLLGNPKSSSLMCHPRMHLQFEKFYFHWAM